MIEDLTFLKEEGDWTKRDDLIRSTSEQLKRSDRTPLEAISEYVSNMRNHKNFLHRWISYLRRKHEQKVFRKRTASEILKSGYVTGCTDTALAFVVLAREMGIPTRYVETFDEQWVQDANADGKQKKGHIFVDISTDGNWRAYEPIKGFTPNNEYVMNGRKYVEVGKGLDFSGVYIKDDRKKSGYRTFPTNLQSLDEAIRLFKPSVPSK